MEADDPVIGTFSGFNQPASDPPSVPVGEPEAPLPTSATIEAKYADPRYFTKWDSGIYFQGRADQHAATRAALLADLAGKAGDEVGALVEQYRDLIVAEAGESNLTQANEYLVDLKSVEQRILARVAALAAERDEAEAALAAELQRVASMERRLAAPDRREREAALEGPWKVATFEGTFGPVWYIDGPAAPKGEEQTRAVVNALNLLASRALPGATEPRESTPKEEQ